MTASFKKKPQKSVPANKVFNSTSQEVIVSNYFTPKNSRIGLSSAIASGSGFLLGCCCCCGGGSLGLGSLGSGERLVVCGLSYQRKKRQCYFNGKAIKERACQQGFQFHALSHCR
jgi:hypothetical protein